MEGAIPRRGRKVCVPEGVRVAGGKMGGGGGRDWAVGSEKIRSWTTVWIKVGRSVRAVWRVKVTAADDKLAMAVVSLVVVAASSRRN